jgi:hypothetical protein
MRKVLSFVLVLSLVLGSFSMAFAATPATGLSDIEGIANEDAIQVNYDLGIVTGNPDGTFLPEKAVNRAEFAAMITRALGVPESALAGYSTTSFKDTVGYGWAVPYLAFCQSKGIMLGDGAGNVMPGRTINTNEAVTMALRAVGYTANSAELVGTWPSNYVTKAQDLGLYDDVAKVVNVDKANAAQIIYNTLTVQKVAVNSDGETKFLWEGGISNATSTTAATNQITLLTSGLGCEKNDDQVIDGTEDALININKYLGQHGVTYTNDDDEVVAFISDSTKLVGKMEADGKTFTTTVEDVDYTTTTAIDLAVSGGTEIVNGAPKAITATSAATEYELNVKLSGKKIVEVYSVLEWSVSAEGVVDASELKDITDDNSLLGVKFTENDDDEIDMNSFALVGVKSLSDISADDVVYVYAADNEITKIEVGTETATGVVTSFKAGSPDKFNIGSKQYKNAMDMVNGLQDGASITSSDVSDDVTAKLDVRGYVYDFEATDGGNKNIAVVERYATGINDEVKIFTAAGKSEVHTYDTAKLSSGSALKNTVIAYSLNKDGKITDSRMDLVSGAALKFKSNTVVTVDGSDKVIASDVVVFTQEADGDLAVSSIDKVEKNTTSTFAGSVLYNVENSKVVGVLVPASQAKASSDDVYAVVNDLYVDDLDGDQVDRIVGFADGAKIDKKADGQYLSFVAPSKAAATNNAGVATFANSVRLYKIEMDADGIITDISTPIATSGKIEVVSGFALSGADGRNSVTVSTTTNGAATAGAILPLADNVVVYEVNSDGDYAVFTGSFKAKDVVVLYELDDDEDGYDLVILNRAAR